MGRYLVRSTLVVAAALASLALLVVGVAACGSSASGAKETTPPPQASPSPGVTSRPVAGLPRVDHIAIIVMENHSASEILGNSDAPFINGLAAKYALATDYSALFHPSLPNYIALTSGSNQGITDDRGPVGNSVDATNIADRIEAAGRTWKIYGESMPAPGATSDAGDYATKHIPFLYYNDIINNTQRLTSHVVPFTQLATDLASADTTPDYIFITPNLANDMHDGSIAQGDAWLAKQIPAILGSRAFAQGRSLLILTWDEGSESDNHVVAIFAGNAAKTAYRSTRPYDHYALLHTIEALWGLPPLMANDAQAPVMSDLLRK
jgi:phosphatidylinositol-3-phosphatase